MSIAPPVDPFDPLVEEWPADQRLVRCHSDAWPPDSFNPTDKSQRFRPIHDEHGQIVPTIYAAGDLEGAIAETVLHDVSTRAPRRLPRSTLSGLRATTLMANRSLRLASLHGHGAGRIGTTTADLIETGPAHYPETVPWSQKIFDHPGLFDGIIWRSRQFNDAFSLMLWQPRVAAALTVDRSQPPLHLAHGAGLQRVEEICQVANIELIDAY